MVTTADVGLPAAVRRIRRFSGARPRSAPDHRQRRVLLAWSLLWLNVLSYSALPTLVHIPSHIGKAVTQGALVAALVVAATANPRVLVRRNLYLVLFSVLAVTAMMMSFRFAGTGTEYRSVRLALFVAVLWMLTPWWGGLTLLKSQLRVLRVILVTVVVGAVIAHHKAFSYGHRLSDAIWPAPPTQVAHYAAELVGLTILMWVCGLVRRNGAIVTVVAGIAVLLLTHTRTALLAMLVGLVVAGLSLLSSKRKVRRIFAAVIITVAVVGPGAAPLVKTWLSRGQSSSQITDLTGRTKVWTALLNAPRPETNVILGVGITNDGFDGLSIDDSWLATYLNQGLLGDVVVGVMLLALLFAAMSRPRGPARAAAIFLVVYALVASFTETGLGEANPYMMDLTIAAALLYATRVPLPTVVRRRRPEVLAVSELLN